MYYDLQAKDESTVKKRVSGNMKQSEPLPDPRADVTCTSLDTELCAFCGEPEDKAVRVFVRPAFLDRQSSPIWVHDDCLIHAPGSPIIASDWSNCWSL